MANEFTDLEKEIDAAEKRAEVEEKINELKEKQLELQQKNTQAAKEIGQSVKDTLSSYTNISETSDTLAGKTTRLLLSSEGIGDAWSKVSKTIGETAKSLNNLLSFTNILASTMDTIVNKTMEFLTAQDQMAQNFERSVGNAAKFKGEIISLYSSTNLYGISLDKAADAYIALKEGLSDFEDLSAKQRMGMGITIAQLDKLGVRTQDLVKIQQTLHKQMGMSTQEVNKLEKQLYGTAVAMGVPPQKMIADFANASPKLAGYGKQMTTVFLDLQSAVKRTGIEMEGLLAMTEKFDTFDSAAEAAGNLNAALGGDFFDTQKLMTLNDAERVKYIQEQLKLSGKSIDSLDRYQQKFISQQLGLKNAAELQSLMNNESGKTNNKLTDQEKAQQQMNKSLMSAYTLTERLNSIWNEFGLILGPVLTPFMDWLKGAATKIGEFIKEVQVWWKATGGGADQLRKHWNDFKETMVKTWEQNLKPIVNKFLGFFGTSTDSLYAAASGGFDKIPEIIDNVKKSILSIPEKIEKEYPSVFKVIKFFKDMWEGADTTGKKIAMVGGAILGTKGIFSILGSIFGSDNEEQVEKNKNLADSIGGEGGGGISGAISAVGQTIKNFSGAFLDFGLAIGGIGVGVGAAAAGIGVLVTALAGLDDKKIDKISATISDMLLKLGIGTGASGVGLAAFADFIGADGEEIRGWLKDFAWAAAALGVGIGLAAYSIGNMIEKVTNLAGASNSVTSINTFITQLATSLGALYEKVGIIGSVAIGNVFDNLGDAFQNLATAAYHATPFLKMFTEMDEEKIIKFHKIFKKGVDEHTLVALKDLGEKSKSFNDEFDRLNKIIDDINNKKLTNIITLRQEIEKISQSQSAFTAVMNSFSNLSQILSSDLGTNLATGVEALNNSLYNLSPEKMEFIEKMGQVPPETLAKLQEANVIRLEAPADSPLNAIAEALTTGGDIEIKIDGERLADIFKTNSAIVAAIKASIVKK